jgi:hypothetical protein
MIELDEIEKKNLYKSIMSQKEAAEKLLSADDTEKRAAWQLVKQNKGLQRVINESFMIFMSRTEDTELLENLGIFWTTAF